MRYVGTPSIMVFVMSLLPFWKKFTTIAHTLSNDPEIIAPHHNGEPFPPAKWAGVMTPTLVMAGDKSPAYMQHSMKAWAAPALVEFLGLASGPVAAKEWPAQR